LGWPAAAQTDRATCQKPVKNRPAPVKNHAENAVSLSKTLSKIGSNLSKTLSKTLRKTLSKTYTPLFWRF
jgi:hypothetical protein